MNYIDLFAGIGGFALGAKWAGMKWKKHFYSEVDTYACKVYAKRFPQAIPLADITKINWQELKKEIEKEWIITGGFPCQDISVAGRGAGIHGKRSGLWFEMHKAIRILRPRYVIAENVGAITIRGLSTVLGSLAEIRYDAEWQDIRASDMGAPHRRERIWIVAYPSDARDENMCKWKICSDKISDTTGKRLERRKKSSAPRPLFKIIASNYKSRKQWAIEPDVGGTFDGFPCWIHRHIRKGISYEQNKRALENLHDVWPKNAKEALWPTLRGFDRMEQAEILLTFMCEHEKKLDQARILMESEKAFKEYVRKLWGNKKTSSASYKSKHKRQSERKHSDTLQMVPRIPSQHGETPWTKNSWEDGIPRVATGIEKRVDRLRCLGNSIVPKIAEMLFRLL